MDRDSSLGIATFWTVRASNPDGGDIFRTFPDLPWDPTGLLYNGYRVFPEEYSGRSVAFTPPSSAEVKEKIELYLYSLFGPS